MVTQESSLTMTVLSSAELGASFLNILTLRWVRNVTFVRSVFSVSVDAPFEDTFISFSLAGEEEPKLIIFNT